MIKKVMEAMENKDYKALADLFADRCQYFDYMPSGIGERNYHAYGKKCIEMFFHNKFYSKQFQISNSEFEDDKTANCFALYNGIALHAKVQIESIGPDGKITHLVIRPA